MTLPAAASLCIWGTAFLQGRTSADLLVDHCGPQSLALLAPMRSDLTQVELLLPTPGDLCGIQTPALAQLLRSGSGAFLRSASLMALPPTWLSYPAIRHEAPPTRAAAEGGLREAFDKAIDLFTTASPAFNLTRPSPPNFGPFPDFWPARLRELFYRANQTLAVCESIQAGWQHSRDEQLPIIISELSRAARRAFEAAVILPYSGSQTS